MSDTDNIVNPGDNFVEHGYCVITDVSNRYKQLTANFDCALGLSAYDELESEEFDFDAGFGCCAPRWGLSHLSVGGNAAGCIVSRTTRCAGAGSRRPIQW